MGGRLNGGRRELFPAGGGSDSGLGRGWEGGVLKQTNTETSEIVEQVRISLCKRGLGTSAHRPQGATPVGSCWCTRGLGTAAYRPQGATPMGSYWYTRG